ncbi:MAG: RNA-binding protein [Lachnospiraceae bacterium]|nr:RNA-binding protein [Lachnospiraceae bacterium]
MTKEEELLKKHLMDLSIRADAGSKPVYSDFLNINEQSILEENAQSFRTGFTCYGGFSMAERALVCFHPDYIDVTEDMFPIACIKIAPLNKKFSDTLTHRDFLGALVNTGIDRSKLGDIIIEDNVAYAFCIEALSEFLMKEITRIKHTTVILTLEDRSVPESIYSGSFTEYSGSVSSLRADAICALATRTSRSAADEIISSKRFFVNAKSVTKKDYMMAVGDVFSVRGYGKYIIEEVGSPNSKNRFKVTLKVFK